MRFTENYRDTDHLSPNSVIHSAIFYMPHR